MVLIVDDDKGTRETFARALRLAGHEVCTAMDGQDALEILKCAAAAIIFTDLHMPKMDGWALHRSLPQNSSKLTSIPFIVVSADIDVEDHGRHLGATAVIPKPADIDDLLRYAAQYDRTAAPTDRVGL